MLNERESLLFGQSSILKAVIVRKDRIYFDLHENYDIDEAQKAHIEQYGDLDGFRSKGQDELPHRVVQYNGKLFPNKGHYAARKWEGGFRRSYPVVLLNDEVIICGVQGNALGFSKEITTEHDGSGLPILNIPFKHNSMFAASSIDGVAYFAGTPRKLFKRIAPNQWVDITSETEHPNLREDLIPFTDKRDYIRSGVKFGFFAFDGFAGDDIYAGGNGGDFWHYNGKQWRRMDLTSNFDIRAIVCAPDGDVYIGGFMGGLIVGRYQDGKERWHNIDTPIGGNCIKEMAWFKDVLYLTTDDGLFTCTKDNGKYLVKPYVFPPDGAAQFSFGGVSACEEALLSYGHSQALIFDGEKWEHRLGKPQAYIPSIDEVFNAEK